jgi:hypothetical protein
MIAVVLRHVSRAAPANPIRHKIAKVIIRMDGPVSGSQKQERAYVSSSASLAMSVGVAPAFCIFNVDVEVFAIGKGVQAIECQIPCYLIQITIPSIFAGEKNKRAV